MFHLGDRVRFIDISHQPHLYAEYGNNVGEEITRIKTYINHMRIREKFADRIGSTGVIIRIEHYKTYDNYYVADDLEDAERIVQCFNNSVDTSFVKIGELTKEEMLTHRNERVRKL